MLHTLKDNMEAPKTVSYSLMFLAIFVLLASALSLANAKIQEHEFVVRFLIYYRLHNNIDHTYTFTIHFYDGFLIVIKFCGRKKLSQK